LFTRLRQWDFLAAARVDVFIANSETTRKRIATHYRRDSIIITPPIDTERFSPGGPVGDYYLVVSRNVPYKRIDLAVEAAVKLGRRVVVVGEGTDRLTHASPLVTFRGKIESAELTALMRGARALLSPQLEDFGMAMLEMNACGRPVIAYAKGGALETLVAGKTGVFCNEQTVDSLADAIVRFEGMTFDSAEIRRHAERFSKEQFIQRMRELVAERYEAKHRTSTTSELRAAELV
jgi:glycosyltransferase involved in cell wall biosynthesis